jgi:4-hydroxy-4-methyl-2-oxoglutarate aldolase
VRDADQLVELGLPVWARWVRIRGATKEILGEIDVPVVVGGAVIRPGDLLVLDRDGVAVVARERVGEVLAAAQQREEREIVKRGRLEAGELSWEIDGLREKAERGEL